MSAGARSLPLTLGAAGAADTTVAAPPAAALTRRETRLRATATVCLAGIALVQAIELPSLFAQGGQFALASMMAMAACTSLGVALAAAPAAAARALWRLVAAAAVLVLTGWALPRAVTIPGLEQDGYGGAAIVSAADKWVTPAGTVCAGLALASLLVAGMARRPARPTLRALATALAVLVTLGPGVWVALVALGPGAVGGEQSLAEGHVHSHAGHAAGVIPEAIQYRPGSGRRGGHYLVAVTPPARQTPIGIGLIGAAALMFSAGAVSHLHRRSAPRRPIVPAGLEEEPA